MVVNIAGRVRRSYYDPAMADEPYTNAIKAFARLAIAAGAEPSRVQAALGPASKCDTTWARAQSLNQLAAAAGTAAEALGLTFELHHTAGNVRTKEFFDDGGDRAKFADTAIKCGAALRRMRAAAPAHHRYQLLQANSSIVAEFWSRAIEHDNMRRSIRGQVERVRCYAIVCQRDPRDWTSRAELFKACGRLVETLDQHDRAVRRLCRLAGDFRWRAIPRTTSAGRGSDRRSTTTALRAKRDSAIASTAAIRAWAIRTSPGPL